MPKKRWDAVILTSQNWECAQAILYELKIRQKKGLISSEALVLSIEDPRPHVGSGSATLNALLIVSEHLSAQSGLTVVSSEVLAGKHIIILHVGMDYPFSGCRQGFLTLPAETLGDGPTAFAHHGLVSLLDLALHQCDNLIAANSPPGVWIWSLDRLVIFPQTTKIEWNEDFSLRLFLVPAHEDDIAEKHGACKLGENNIIEDIFCQASYEQLVGCHLKGKAVPASTGIIYMKTTVAEKLLELQVYPPLDSCTYYGMDNGVHIVKNLSLVFDILLACATDISEGAFVNGRRDGFHPTKAPEKLDYNDHIYRRGARAALWKALHEYTLKGELIEGSSMHFLTQSPRQLYKTLTECQYQGLVDGKLMKFGSHVHVLFKDNCIREKNFTAVNSIFDEVKIGAKSAVYNSYLKGNIAFGKGNIIMNINTTDTQCLPPGFVFDDDLMLTSVSLKNSTRRSNGSRIVLTLIGTKDVVELCVSDPKSSFCNKPWDDFFDRTKIQPSELWTPETDGKYRCLLNARLFPVFNPEEDLNLLDLLWLQGSCESKANLQRWRSSCRLSLQEMSSFCAAKPEFEWRRHLYYEIGKLKAVKALKQESNECMLPFFRTCTVEGNFDNMLEALDDVIMTTKSHAIIARTFACIADVFGAKATPVFGLRSGPAANASWKKGLVFLENGNVSDAVAAFAAERKNWVTRPDLLIRAARHYEGAFQVQLRKAVMTAKKFVNLKPCEPIKVGQMVVAEAPARIDLAGTWSDTPPICFENGGAVVTVGVKVCGKKPIKATVTKIPEPKIFIKVGFSKHPVVLECTDLSDLLTYTQLNSPGALIKAVIVCSEIVCDSTSQTLAEILLSKHQGGFVVQTGADLPLGSGLGTSSILAGALIAALWKSVGLEPDPDSIVHAVLLVEQMMTTGGGWQDQIGGIHPGIKLGSSKKQLPLQVNYSPIPLPEGFLDTIEKHLLLIFTGKTRLARNMLQDVLRHWNARLPEIVETGEQLVANANACVDALKKGDLEGVGRCLNTCWEQKKLMAAGCEPRQCEILMKAIKPLLYGQCLTGAGGGGFSCALTKEPYDAENIEKVIKNIEGLNVKPKVYPATIDREGLTVRVENVDKE